MGFDCSINKIKKIYKGTSIRDIMRIEEYLRWKNNPWNFEERIVDGEKIEAPYPTYEKYWSLNHESNEKYPKEPSEDYIDYYQKIYEENNKKYYGLSETLDFWGSSGRYVDSEIMAVLDKYDEYTYGPFTKENTIELIENVSKELEDCKLVPAYINYSYKYNDNGEDIILNKCDGIVAENIETGEETRVPTSEEYGEIVYVPSKNFEEDKYYALNSLKETLIKILQTDFENEIVWYSRSY